MIGGITENKYISTHRWGKQRIDKSICNIFDKTIDIVFKDKI